MKVFVVFELLTSYYDDYNKSFECIRSTRELAEKWIEESGTHGYKYCIEEVIVV